MKGSKQLIWLLAALPVLCLVLASCGLGGRAPSDTVEFVIGISQANMREQWRLVLMEELEEEAAKYPNVRLIFTDATQDSAKQIEDIQRLVDYGADLLIISPSDAQVLTPVVSQVYQSIPVIVMDRVVEGYDYSLFIGPDNYHIGVQAGEALAELSGGEGTVLALFGSPQSQASVDRSQGLAFVLDQYPGITTLPMQVGDESRDAAEDLVTALGPKLEEINYIYAHNDYIALGASLAVRKLGYYHIRIVGVDGFSGENGGLELIRDGRIQETVTCPTGGREAIQFSMNILREESGVPKQVILRSHRVTLNNVDSYQRSLDKEPVSPGRIVDVGYVQVGTESGWRLANNDSITKAARDFGIHLVAVDANQSQQRQIEAVQEFIQQGMDVIVLSPVVDSGWDEVLLEAREAGIPILLSDRKISVEDDSLYKTYIGADFIEEGRRAASWLMRSLPADKHAIRILEIQGTVGATPTLERKQGFEGGLEGNPDYHIIHSRSGDFTLEGGIQVVEEYLLENGLDFDVIFAHNDDMALGAVEALRGFGVQPGRDVQIISVDGTRPALEALQRGEMNCVVECSPLLGPQLMKAISDLMSGRELPLRIITDEVVFTQENVGQYIKSRLY